MNKAYKIKNELRKVGREVFLADGDWISTPFWAVVSPRWRYSKSDFENEKTQIGEVSADYFTYIGPFDHNIECISENGFLLADGVKYVFKEKECVKCGGSVQFFSGVLRRVEGEDDDIS